MAKKPCSNCGGDHLTTTRLGQKPSLGLTLLIGWPYLLIKSAFSSQTFICTQCQKRLNRRGFGNNLSLVLFIGAIALVAIVIASDLKGLL